MMQIVASLELADEAERVGEVARREQHAGDDELLDRVRVRAGRVEDRHAALPKDRRPECCSTPAPARATAFTLVAIGDFVHVGRAHQDRVGFGDVVRDAVEIRRQPIEAVARDVVEGLDLEHAVGSRYPLRFAKSFMKSTSACTPASGIAL